MKKIKRIQIIPDATVKIIEHTPNPDKTVFLAARTAYSNKSWEKLLTEAENEEKIKQFLEMLYQRGHHSVFEHASFTFLIEGCSRVCTHQLVRHRLASYTQQSQRYAGAKGKFHLPDSIMNNPEAYKIAQEVIDFAAQKYNELLDLGIHQEDARYLIPQAVTSRIVVTMNARELLHFFELRTCMHAQKEIRMVAWKMLNEVKKIAPIIFAKAGPPCISRGVCHENDLTCPLYTRYVKDK